MAKSRTMKPLAQVLDGYQLQDKGGYITKEFQDYGYRLACEMGEESKKAMYIRMAKTMPRSLLERARTYVLDAPHVRNKGKLLLWVVGKLKRGEPLNENRKPTFTK